MIVESWCKRAARLRPQACALECGGRRIAYRELLASSAAGARQLARLGIGKGDLVAIELGPSIELAQALHACWLLGAIAMPIDLRLTGAERDALCESAALRIAEPLSADSTASEASDEKDALLREATHDLGAVAVVLHTSGTTSKPKRVQLTFGNLLWSALGSAVALGCDSEERWLCTLPVCHVGGLSILVRSAIFASTAVIHPRFEIASALEALTHERITVVSVVATTLRRLLEQGLEHPPRLRCALAGGGPVPESLLADAAKAGVSVCATYGLTEACSQVSTVPLAALARPAQRSPGQGAPPPPGLCGPPLPGPSSHGAGPPLFCTQVKIAADGEILVQGPTVALGAASEDGLLHTGDLGHLDERGNLHVTGRKADTIVSGGENVAPAEVEALLEAHPLVAEAAVLGRAHPEWGEAVTAIIVPVAGARPRIEDLRAHCAAGLAPFKVPKEFVLLSGPLPRTRSGKLLRRELR